jgi:hypothetical protein
MEAWLAQSVEHETLNLRVVGSSPTLGDLILSLQSCLFKQPANGFFRLKVDFRDEVRMFLGGQSNPGTSWGIFLKILSCH